LSSSATCARRPPPIGRLRRDRLARRLAALTSDGRYAARTTQVAAGLAGEAGEAVAVTAVERFLGRRRPG